jgi:hypothetical protein
MTLSARLSASGFAGMSADEPRDLADGGHEIVPPLALQTLRK